MWVQTFGDMMSLLLTFFILLVSLSEIKKEDQWKAIVEEVKKAFGMKGGGGKLPTKEDPELTMQQRLEAIQLHKQKEPNESNSDDPGMEGRETTVQTVRKGVFTTGGQITFEPGSADLSESVRRLLGDVVEREKLRGKSTVIELRGHAASLELGAEATTADLADLSYARAKAVMKYLTEDLGMAPERFSLVARGAFEPLKHRAYATAEQEPNRRVEMLVTEDLVDDWRQPQ